MLKTSQLGGLTASQPITSSAPLRVKQIRQSIVEPVFGTLTHYYGMSKLGVKGKAGAHKVMLMAAIAFNLKKYMKFEPVKVKRMAKALERTQTLTFSGCTLLLIYSTTMKSLNIRL